MCECESGSVCPLQSVRAFVSAVGQGIHEMHSIIRTSYMFIATINTKREHKKEKNYHKMKKLKLSMQN